MNYRQDPVPGTGVKRAKPSHIRRIKHTAWYRDARLHGSKPEPKHEDFNLYHTRSKNEGRSWKNKKVARQWMRHLT